MKQSTQDPRKVEGCECEFCKIVAGTAPATIVYEDRYTIGFLPHKLRGPVHVLVVPKKHVDSLRGLGEDVLALGRVMRAVNRIAKQMRVSEWRTVINTGARAQQTVFHLHVHLLGLRATDSAADLWNVHTSFEPTDRTKGPVFNESTFGRGMLGRSAEPTMPLPGTLPDIESLGLKPRTTGRRA